MAGFIQVPVDGAGKMVDGVPLTDAGVTVYRQKLVVTGGSGTAEVVVVTNAAPSATDMGLVVRQAGTATVTGIVVLGAGATNIGSINNISATVIVAGVVSLGAGTNLIGAVSNAAGTALMGAVSLAAGTANIGFINGVSATVNVAIATPFIIQGISTTVNVAIATPFIVQGISTTVQVAVGTPFTVNNISATVVTGLSYVIEKTTNSQVQIGDSANAAIRVNVVAGSAGGPSMTDNTTYSTGASLVAPAGYIFFSASATAVTDGRIAAARITDSRAVHINLRNNAGAEVGIAAAPISVKVENTSATASVILAAGTANIGAVSNAAGTALMGAVSLAAGTANIGFLNNISATVIVAGVVSLGAGTNLIGAVSLAAGTANFGTLNDISRTVQVAIGTPFILQGISTTVQVAIGTPFILQGISTTVQVAIATPYIIQGISTTVTTVSSNTLAHDTSVTAGITVNMMGGRANLSAPTAVTSGDASYLWMDLKGRPVIILNHPALLPSASHGPKCVTCSTSAGIALIAAPGAGLAVYITKIACTNGSGTLTRADVFQASATASCTCQMYMAASGGGFTMDYNPPIQVQSNTGVTCRVDPSVSQVIFNVHFYVGNK